VVDLYLSDIYASITPDVKRLKGFQKINLKPNETKTVTFKLSKNELSFINYTSQRVVEPGDFEVTIADLKAKFNVK
jgi:beta-glucosidase